MRNIPEATNLASSTKWLFALIWEFFTNCPQIKKANILCQLHFSCVIKKELDQWNLQPWNVVLLDPLISHFIFISIIHYKWGRQLQINGNTKSAIINDNIANTVPLWKKSMVSHCQKGTTTQRFQKHQLFKECLDGQV